MRLSDTSDIDEKEKGAGRVDPFVDSNRPLDKNMMRYIWRYTRLEQMWIIFVVAASMPPYFFSLTLPVLIINGPIQGEGFEDATATKNFLEIDFTLPDWMGGMRFDLLEGWAMERWPYLIALSCLFLALVCINGLFKFYINTYKGRLGERMLRRMRFQLTDRVLRFPVGHFKRLKSAEVSSMIKDEVEPFGEFIGDAFMQPAFLGGQALVAFVFILTQSFWLGLIAVAIIAIQMVIIPILRRRVLELGRERQVTARLLSGRIGEIVEAITAVRMNDTSNYERSEISNRLGQIFFIRYELYQRKFFIKFLNNFLAQLTPFLFYVVGGYLAIRGTLNVGQLVGVINAYKDLPTPIKGLITWDQKRVDIDVKYAQIVENFNVPGLLDAHMQAPFEGEVPPLEGDIEMANVSAADEMGSPLLESVDFKVPIAGVTAAVGPPGSGAGAVTSTIAGLTTVSAGRVTIGGQSVHEMPEYVRGRRIAYAGSESYLPQMSLIDTLLYPNKHLPLRSDEKRSAATELHPKAPEESHAAGGSRLDYYADWVDYEAMGLAGPEALGRRLHSVLEMVELHETVYDLAMRQMLDPKEERELTDKLLEARRLFEERLPDSGLDAFVEVFEPDEYNANATIAENLVFGASPKGSALAGDNLADDEFVREVLERTKLDATFFEMGIELAETAIELFADLAADNPFFEQLNFMRPEELELYPPVVAEAKKKGFEESSSATRRMLIALPFLYSEPRNRLGLLDDELEARVLEARTIFHEEAPEELRETLSFYEPEAYNAEASVEDNILFGRIAYGFSDAREKVQETTRALLEELGLEERIFEVGLKYDIGAGGKRLSEGQRQRVALARAVLKRPDLMIVNRAMNALDGRSQVKIVERIVAHARGEDRAEGEDANEGDARTFGLFWTLANTELADRFDHVLVFERGQLAEQGAVDDLKDGDGAYAKLVA